MTAHETMVLFLSLGLLIGLARALGEVARWVGQPALLGEIVAGVLLGPTVLGAISPNWEAFLFPTQGPNATFLAGFATVSIALFLLVAGIEVDLSLVWRQGKAAMGVGLAGIVFPFSLGFGAAFLAPGLLGQERGGDLLIFSLFFATAISISSLPVIARTLMDLSLYRSDLGMIVIAAAIFNDLVGWIIFGLILGMMGSAAPGGFTISQTVVLTLLLAAFSLTGLRWAVDRMLPWLQAHTTWPGGVLSFALALALFGAALAEWIGIHAVFGAFLVGVAIGDSAHLREQTRTFLNQFVSLVFAPLFFATIGLRVNFVDRFDLPLVLVVLVIACIGKLIGCYLGARSVGIDQRDSWAMGFAMNARGAMEIILGLLALQYGLIHEPMFVALVVMALVTSMVSGPAMQRILRLQAPRRFYDYLSSRNFVSPLMAQEAGDAIRELAGGLTGTTGIAADQIARPVLARERLMSTGLGSGIAVPHARVAELTRPAVAVGISQSGIDFNSPDGELARIILLILIPEPFDGTEVEILAHIARTFRQPQTCHAVIEAGSYTEFLARVKGAAEAGGR